MGRSGGGALVTSLGKLADGDSYLSEPLLGHGINDETQLKELIDNLIERVKNENIKVVKQNLGTFSELSDQKRKSLNQYLFDRFSSIILNRRRNVLKRNISSIIGGKTGNWHGKTKNYFSKLFEKSFRIDIEEMEEWVLRIERRWRENKEYIKGLENIQVVSLEYENFFQEISLNSRLRHLKGIYKTLLKESPSDENLLDILDLLSNKQKMNNRDTYSVVQNIESVNKNLGPKYGFLF